MGKDADFDGREGAACPELVAKLRNLPEPPSDPELLARLIDGHAGIDLDFGFIGLESDLRLARQETLKQLLRLKSSAQELNKWQTEHSDDKKDGKGKKSFKLKNRHSNLNLIEAAILDLLDIADPSMRLARTERISAAISTLADVPLPNNLASFGKKPVNDEAIERVVTAIAVYFSRLGQAFSGAPRSVQTAELPKYPLHSEQAILTKAVLDVLRLPVPDKSLATYIKKARKAVAGFPPSKS